MHSKVETQRSDDDGAGAVATAPSTGALAQKDRGLWQVRGDRHLFRDLLESLRNPEFWTLSAWLDIVVTYRRSRLGPLWLIMPSAVYIWGVGSVFAGLWHTHITHFVAQLALGWTVFTVMHSVIVQSTMVLQGSRSFIMDGRTRLTDFILRSMAKAVFYFLMALPMTALAVAVFPSLHPWGLLVALGAFVLVIINTFTAGVVFALMGARFPDIQEVVNNIFRVLFLFTPIVWLPAQMPPHSLRGQIARMNPFYHLIEVFRAPILGEHVSVLSWSYVGILTVSGIALAAFLYRRYARLVPIWL